MSNTTSSQCLATRNAFRRWGYLQAEVDSFGRIPHFPHSDLDNAPAEEAAKWREIYCGTIGLEFMHIPFPERCEWLAKKMEEGDRKIDARYVLDRIISSETFEEFLHRRYIGTKRFSLEGNAALIPLMDSIIGTAAELGSERILIGMAHRGRLNVLHHIVKTTAENIIAGFEDIDPKSSLGSDDVKYHKGATGVYKTPSGKEVFIDLASNPSHLEVIGPGVMGKVRAVQERLSDKTNKKVMAIIIHGDAAFAGQGITAESLNFESLPGFKIGGVVHIILNNLIGFTTAPEFLHSSRYSSDLAKRLNIPILHVNGEKPNDVAYAGQLLTEYRYEFKTDVVIDLIGYRRFGHQEQDDPTITSPALYRTIKERPLLRQLFAAELGIDSEQLKVLEKEAVIHLEEGLEKGRLMTSKPKLSTLPNFWAPYVGGFYDSSLEVDTNTTEEVVSQVASSLDSFPDDFTIHPKVKRIVESRKAMLAGQRGLDWGMAENLAFGSLLLQGVPVRLTGQDSRRGTFSHRHAVFWDYENGSEHIPLTKLSESQARFDIYDSMLSEAAALAFEYGFSRAYPEALVCWEAQFGDFVNGAQIVIDQFLTAGEDKWSLLSGLVMLLPHGYEGAGPEHSSARLERFLQSAAEHNIQVIYPSSAAQYFHMLRRQALRAWRKPLVMMTPKSMLRAPAACSPLDDFTSGAFQPLIVHGQEREEVERVIICTGKITHELSAEKLRGGHDNTIIISIEQLYPLPEKEIESTFKLFPNARAFVWVQEEPANMGALGYIRPLLNRLTGGKKVTKVSRSESASPATGSPKAHAFEQDALIRLAFPKY